MRLFPLRLFFGLDLADLAVQEDGQNGTQHHDAAQYGQLVEAGFQHGF